MAKTLVKNRRVSNAGPKNILYVVLHGLICLVDFGKKGFVAHLLEIGSDHKYLFGDWLAEQEIPPREKGRAPFTAHLHGVDEGSATLDRSENLVILCKKKPKSNHPSVRAVFHLPRPARILHFIQGKIVSSNLQGNLKVIDGNPKRISGIRIFEYGFDDKDLVFLKRGKKSFLWNCPDPAKVASGKKSANIAVLHIYNQPGLESMVLSASHVVNEFNKSTAFLGVNLKLKKPTPSVPQPSTAPAGFLPGETACLSHRRIEVLKMLLEARENRRINFGVGGCGGTCADCDGQVLEGA